MTQIDKTTFKSNTATLFADNVTGDIGANDLRTQMDNIADSAVFTITGQVIAPTINDDASNTAGNGTFNVSDVWVNEVTNKAYMCVDNTTGNAVWLEITFSEASAVSAADGPQADEIAFWLDPTTLGSTSGNLTWDGSQMSVTGNLLVSGTVDGRDLSVDGSKLDGIPADAIASVATTSANVAGTSTGGTMKTLIVETGDGLAFSFAGTTATLRVDNNNVTVNTASRTLAATDNGSFITNAGAVGAVTWTLPVTASLDDQPRLVATFFKVANQTMNIVGANTVSVNGVSESGGNESLIEICPTPYDSFAVVLYAGSSNSYYVYQGTDISKVNAVANTELAFWTADGVIDGAPEMLWDGSALAVDGEVVSNWTFNAQVGTTYTAALTDRGRIVTMNNVAANTFTIPDDTAVNFPIGTEIRVLQIGAGATSIAGSAGGGGVTLNGILAGTGALTGQWDEVRLYKAAADTWYATGDIGAVA